MMYQGAASKVGGSNDGEQSSLVAGQKGGGVNHDFKTEKIVIFLQLFENSNLKRLQQHDMHQPGNTDDTLYWERNREHVKQI